MSPTNLANPKRLQALAETCLVNSPPEDSFDRYTRLCAALLEVPVSMVVLVEVDRLFFKSRYSRVPLPVHDQSAPVTQSFCYHVVKDREAFLVGDCCQDERTRDSPAVKEFHIRAYAGLPVRTPEGEVIGSFCAVDVQPRNWSERELALLTDLRNGVESEIALRLQVVRLDGIGAELRGHLRAAQKLFSDLGHEVRTPLNAMVNLSQACVEQQLPPPADGFAQKVLENALHLSKLLEGILDLAALEAGHVLCEAVPTEIGPLLGEQQSAIAALGRSDLSMRVILDPEMPGWLALDGRRLGQLLRMLVQFHLGRGDWKGTLALEASWPEDELLEFRLSCDSYRLAPEELASLFSPTRSPAETAGLSPAIINSLADLLLGRLWASSDSAGVHFHLRVPASATRPPGPPQPSEKVSLSVLAIDDDATNLCVMEFLVRKLGHRLITATSGPEGLSLMEQTSFDLLLLDLRMSGMDGFEVARRVRERGWKLPIVAVTADASESARQRAHASGMDAFMTKPVQRTELARVLESFIHKR
jgi:CheY-like chemotaxis protein